MLAFHGLLDHPLRQLEVSLSSHRVSHRGVQTPAAAHCHQHRIHSLILLLSPMTRHPSRGTVDTEGRYVPLFLQQLQ